MNASDFGRPTFRPLRSCEEPVTRAPRREQLSGPRLFAGRDGLVVAIPQPLVERMVAFAKKAAPNECFGLVVGRACRDREGPYVVVHGVVPDPQAKASRACVATTTESEVGTRLAADVLYPDAAVIGWWHSHPGYGLRYSAEDRRNQRTWTAGHAIGIVVDPTHPDLLAVYRGPDAELLRPEEAPPQPLEPETCRDTKRQQVHMGTRRARPRRLRALELAVLASVLVWPAIALFLAFGVSRDLGELKANVQRLAMVEPRPVAQPDPAPTPPINADPSLLCLADSAEAPTPTPPSATGDATISLPVTTGITHPHATTETKAARAAGSAPPARPAPRPAPSSKPPDPEAIYP